MVEFWREQGDPGQAWTVCPWHEAPNGVPALAFDDALAAAQWLRGASPGALRRLAFALLEPPLQHRQTDAALADALGAMLFDGTLRAFAGRLQQAPLPGAGDAPSAEQLLLRRLPTTARNFAFEGERWRIVDARHWASLRGSEDERFEVVPRVQAQQVLGRLVHWHGLSADEARAVEDVVPRLPAAWRPARPEPGLLLIRIVDRGWTVDSSDAAESVTPSQLGAKPKQTPEHWIQIELVDTDNRPVPGAAYKVALPDGAIREGRLDKQGMAYIGGMALGGPCKVCFPQIDSQEWRAL